MLRRMTRAAGLAAGLVLLFSLSWAGPKDPPPIVGDCVGQFTLAPDNQDVLGLTFDEMSEDGPRLFVLDASRKIFVYGVARDAQNAVTGFTLREAIDLPPGQDGKPIESPRGLAFTLEDDRPVLYFLNWSDSGPEVVSELWRYDLGRKTAESRDLSLYVFRIGDRELLGLAYLNGKLFVSFDAEGYQSNDLRVRRGIAEFDWNQAYDGRLDFVRHLPDAGTAPCRDLTTMVLDGARYLWGTVGDDYIYVADAASGRGIFHFDRPKPRPGSGPGWELAFGADYLWVSENTPGPDVLHEVNVTKNLDAVSEGPRMLRHLIMTIDTVPEREGEANSGMVTHNYSRPYAYEQLGNQGVWPKTERIEDVSKAPNGAARTFTYDPAGDVSSRQHMAKVEYADAAARSYSSKYEVDLWTNPYRKFVYPHRVDLDRTALKGTNYLEDDPELFNLTDTETYENFKNRIKAYIRERYGVEADMHNPYWAARDAVEYIQDHYYYPARDKRKPAAVDYDNRHYDANPGNLKIALSDHDYDKMQIIACSGTSVMLAGYMRFLGFPARWLGTGTEQNPGVWDKNGNGLLDKGERAPVSSGHRYDQVWLGSHYGWICFDATPTLPPFKDFDPVPPSQPQWRFMNRTARGHLKDKRIVFNVGSKLFRPLYRDFEYDEKLAINNDCGGDQRYNLQGRFEKPELWKYARQRIFVENLCFVNNVTLTGPRNATQVGWMTDGQWTLDPEARLEVILQQMDPATGKFKNTAVLAEGLAPGAGSVPVDLTAYGAAKYRIRVQKMGDDETGGLSSVFDLQ